MNLVIDANILFSILIKQGKTIEILLNPLLNLYAPVFIFDEVAKHKDEILEKTGRTENELIELMSDILSIVKFIARENIEESLPEAEAISPDKDDSTYFALALKFNCAIWSNDKRLKSQNKIKVYSTNDLQELFKQE